MDYKRRVPNKDDVKLRPKADANAKVNTDVKLSKSEIAKLITQLIDAELRPNVDANAKVNTNVKLSEANDKTNVDVKLSERDAEEEFNVIKYKQMLNKENEKKRKWNQYMRTYNARKKKEHEEQLNKVVICFSNFSKSYDKEEIVNAFLSIIATYTTIINNNINLLTEDIVEEINKIFESNNLLHYIRILDKIVKELIK